MDAFIMFAATRFGLTPNDVRALCGGLLWLMQLHGGEEFSALHQRDPTVRRLVDQAPAALADSRPEGRALFGFGQGRVCGTGASVIRLFARHGFSLKRAGRFTRALLAFLATWVGREQIRDIAGRTPVVVLLLTRSQLSDPPRLVRITPSAGPIHATA